MEYIFNRIDTIRINQLARNYSQFDIVFTGHRNTQEHLTAKLNPREVYIMDSGQTLDKIRSSGYIDYRFKYYGSRFKKLMLKLTGLKIYERKNVKLFTVYADSATTKHEIVPNNQDYKKELIKKMKKGDKVIFISSPFYKFKPYISIETYIAYIERVIESLHIKKENFVYVPNPIRESPSEISTIINRLNCSCDDRLLTVEDKVSTYDELPAMCVSPCSTALVNIDIIAEGKIDIVAAWHPEFNCFKFLKDWKQDITQDKKRSILFREIENLPPFFNFDPEQCKGEPLYRNLNDV
jgi:hypothetical protein